MKLHRAEHDQGEGDETKDEEKRAHVNASRRPQKACGAFLASGDVITLPRVENGATGFLAGPRVNPGVLERMMNDRGRRVNGRLSGSGWRS